MAQLIYAIFYSFLCLHVCRDIDFNLDLLERDSCMSPSSFDEGVELAIRIGRDWIPLHYISPNLPDNRHRNSNFLIGDLNDQVVTIRGYTLR